MKRGVERLGQISDIDLRLLRVFRAVVDAAGFTPAAALLGISRSAVSIHMGELETRLGFTLCQRGRSGFVLTAEGEAVDQAARRLIAHLQSFRNEVNALHHELRGELNIGITDNLVTLPEMRITDALAALKDRGPAVHTNIHMMPPGHIETAVLDGRLHVGVTPALSRLAALDYIALYTEQTLLYAAVSHPLASTEAPTVAAIEAADAVLPAYPLSDEAQAVVDRLNHTATASEREGIAFLVLTGRYIGLLPEHYAQRWVDAGRLVALRPDIFSYAIDYHTITRSGRRPNRVLDTFLDRLVSGPMGTHASRQK
ncbi:LysR family transcriptional regulator [Salinisphaera hydrothermalis]|uniref:LysR family transcriptional regulator n=1 Tax=Salinisphaera hydrothermalis (strain C41B8) TaxID=1304275 RepID=A0A084IRM8_SALHC|nr:LysR family transcriptional regulator [Salinisphaera hydrothermalis]KEZ79362.1 LysR family transcriptional regulator [Salinisphaera hydrothermalis C41B8]